MNRVAVDTNPTPPRAPWLQTARAALSPPTPLARCLVHVSFVVAFATLAWAVGRSTGTALAALAIVPFAFVSTLVLLPSSVGAALARVVALSVLVGLVLYAGAEEGSRATLAVKRGIAVEQVATVPSGLVELVAWNILARNTFAWTDRFKKGRYTEFIAHSAALVQDREGVLRLLLVCRSSAIGGCQKVRSTWDGWARVLSEAEVAKWRTVIRDRSGGPTPALDSVPVLEMDESPEGQSARLRTICLILTLVVAMVFGGRALAGAARRSAG